MPVEGRRQMAEIDVAADLPLGPQPFDGGVYVDGVPGDDGAFVTKFRVPLWDG